MNIYLTIFEVSITILFFSCSKQEGPAGFEGYEDHPTWTQQDSTAFWDKQQGDITIKPYTP